MNSNRLKIIPGLAAALILSACGAAAEKSGGERASATPGASTQAPAPQAAAAADAPTANTAAAPAPATNAAAAPPGDSKPGGAKASPPAPMPTPVIGSGGNDFFLFTQARAAVNADPELKAANLILEVKDGVVTLSGAVASAAQKSKAEQLVRAVGPKNVKNQLRVAAGS